MTERFPLSMRTQASRVRRLKDATDQCARGMLSSSSRAASLGLKSARKVVFEIRWVCRQAFCGMRYLEGAAKFLYSG